MSSTKQREQPRVSAGAELIDEKGLLDVLEKAHRDGALLMLHSYWMGCPACGEGTPLSQAIDRLQEQYEFLRGDFPWREGRWDSAASDFFYDFRMPVTRVYRLFWELVVGKRQRYGGRQTIESYAKPPWKRHHFPQLYFIDGKRINSNALRSLTLWYNAADSEHPECGDEHPAANGLFNFWQEVILMDLSEPGSDKWDKLNTIRAVLPDDAVLLQLLNEHMFTQSDVDLQADALNDTFACVVRQHGDQPVRPSICFRFSRGPDDPNS